MKTILFALVMCAIGICACTHQEPACSYENNKSWMAYCQAYGVNPEHPTSEESDFYLDCFVGSTEEECFLSK